MTTARWLLLLLPLLAACSAPEERTLTERWPDGNVKREVVVLAGDTTEIAVYDEAGRLSKVSRSGRTASNTANVKPSIGTASRGLCTNTTTGSKWGLLYVASQRQALHHRAIRLHWQPHRYVAFLQ